MKEKIDSLLKIVGELKSGALLMAKELDKVKLQLEEISSSIQVEGQVTVPPEKRSTLFDNLPKEKVTIRRVSEETKVEAKIEQPKYNIQVVGLGVEKV